MTCEMRGGARDIVDPIRGATLILVMAGGWIAAAGCFAMQPRDMASAISLGFALALWIAVVVIVRSDLADYIIPDGASVAIAIMGLCETIAIIWASGLGVEDAIMAGVSALALGLGAFVLFASVAEAFRRFGGREALGFGDVKLAGALAIWLTPGDAALALEIAALVALAVLLIVKRGATRDTAMPFGAFMAPAAWLVYVAGPVLRDVLS